MKPRRSAAPIVVQTESFAPQLLPLCRVLIAEVVDRVALLWAQPSADRNQQESKPVQAPAPGIRIAANTAATGAATCTI
jgi:hypothetical protein